MQTAFLIARILHIGAGMIAFFVAPGALVTTKGMLWHRRWGKVYFWSMAVVASTAFPMAVYHPSPFLFMIALFSFYLALSGYRILYQKRRLLGSREEQGPTRFDWIAACLGLAAGVGLMGFGAWLLARGDGFGSAAMVFGALGTLAAGADIRRFRRPSPDKRTWLFHHMGYMMAAYIATVTAFSAVNLHLLPILVRWLWPTFLGTPLIVLWIRRLKGRLPASAVVTSRDLQGNARTTHSEGAEIPAGSATVSGEK